MVNIKAQSLEDNELTGNTATARPKFFPASDAEKIAKELIQRFHPHLIDANIEFTYRDGKWNKNGRPVIGDVKLMSPYFKALTDLDFGIIINYNLWSKITSPKQHRAMLDHLLAYCYFTEDKKGNLKWKKIAPTIHEFPEIIARNGAYSQDVAELEESLKEFSKQ